MTSTSQLAERAEFDCGGADSAVDGRGRGAGELAGQGADLVGGHAAVGGDGLRREPVRPAHEARRRPLTWSATPPRSGATRPSSKSTCTTANSSAASVPGRGGDVAVGEFGGAGAGRVDDGEPAAALAQRPELAGEVGGGGQTAVGHKGIRADDHQIVGAVEVGHREGDGAAEQVAERDVLGHLVQRAGGDTPGGCRARG